MYKILTLNKIAEIGLSGLPKTYFEAKDNISSPEGVLVRSASMHEFPMGKELLCIARAGAGVNNIPIEECSKKGIVVFNTPGANANAVRELALCALFLASRDIISGIEWAKGLSGSDVPAQVEKGKSRFAGPEIAGKTLGIIGLGAIGAGVANAAHHIGMDVLGFDPYISVDSAWGLSRSVRRAKSTQEVFASSDYISIHVPLNKESKETLGGIFEHAKPGVRLLNFSRGELFDNDAMLKALESGVISRYVTDFPNEALVKHPNVIPIPHLGASTPESEDNCAIMAVNQLKDYIMNGNIKNSVNLPDVELPHAAAGFRVCVIHRNIPRVLSDISSIIADRGVNIENMINKSKGDYAYTLLDAFSLPAEAAVSNISSREGILRVRVIKL